jgi:cystathionine beta-lyase/cystathionine gamma-synthase
MKEKRIESLAEELRHAIDRANRIIKILNSQKVTVRIYQPANPSKEALEIVDIIQEVEY